MFKRFSIGVLVAAVLALGVTGLVLAQGPTPPSDGFCPFGGTCGRSGSGMGGFGYQGALPAALADALGMTAEDLYAALSEGQTVAEIAVAQGVDLDDVVAALVAPRVERMEQAVADGNLTQEQADRMIEEMTEHMRWQLENFSGWGGGYGGSGRGGCPMQGGGSRWGGRWGSNSSMPHRFGYSQQAAPSTDASL